MSDVVLTLNAGSSSLKYALFARASAGPKLVSRGQVEGIGTDPRMIAKDAAGRVLSEHRWPAGARIDHEAFLEPLFAWLEDHLGADTLAAVGHRIVHGGRDFSRPVVIDDAVLERLDELKPLAPLHQPHNLAAVRAVRAIRPGLPQVGCFDTAFHHDHADVVARFALPGVWHEQGVRRYGFHGLSYEFVSGRLRELDPALAAQKVVVAHLGNGASLCALDNGRSVDTTMGLTALDGLVMGTRCGALDPGVILYLQQQAGLSVSAVETLLYEQSGLLGVSGLSSDMRSLLAASDPNAKFAIDLFVFRIVKETCALAGVLGGLDGLVFTAGIGENAPAIRAAVAGRLAWLGVELDPQANARGPGQISTAVSKAKVWVVPTDEEAMIARHTHEIMDGD